MESELALIESEPALAWKLWRLRGGDPAGEAEARETVRRSPLVARLLADRRVEDNVPPARHPGPLGGSVGMIPHHPYAKWDGPHWVLAALADLGYPEGDRGLAPLFEQEYAWLMSREQLKTIRAVDGRVRRCASLEGNALYSAAALGLEDDTSAEIARRLTAWQWPPAPGESGRGWNCDKRPAVRRASFHETLIPMRGLIWWAKKTGDPAARAAAACAAELFLSRGLFRRLTDGEVIDPEFLRLHYPAYWHYDVLSGLKVLGEAGYLGDPRCAEALDWLESRRLPGGGFPADRAWYRVIEPGLAGPHRSSSSLVDWGGTSTRRANPFVTADALWVLKMAGRWSL